MRKQKFLFVLLLIFILAFFLPVVVHADMGPKPYISIEFNIDKTYQVTLLSKQREFGPYSTYGKSDDPMDKIFAMYEDEYYFVHVYHEISPEYNTFFWTYYPPNDFKVLLYDAETETFMISEAYSTFAFQSSFKCKIKNGVPVLTKISQAWLEIGNLLIRMAVTLIIEIGLAFAFRFRKHEFILIAIANVVTQLILNIILILTFIIMVSIIYYCLLLC